MLSVVVPVYNTAPYLRQCVDSLVAQSFRDLEIIVVDDGSTDGSARIVAEYARANDSIVVIRKPNGGLADARNHGIAVAQGEYVGFVDSDDRVSPEMFQHMCECARATDADVVVCRMVGFDAESDAERPSPEGPIAGFGLSLKENPSLLVGSSPSVCNKIFRKSLFTEHRLFFPVGLAFEDLATTYSLLAHANRIEMAEKSVYFYRRARGGSIMGSFGCYGDLTRALEMMYERFTSDDLFETFRDPIMEVAFAHLILGRYADFLPYAPWAAKSAYVDRVFEHLDRHFPGWKHSAIVRRACTSRWQRGISTHRLLLKLYSALPARLAIALSQRLGMFWRIPDVSPGA